MTKRKIQLCHEISALIINHIEKPPNQKRAEYLERNKQRCLHYGTTNRQRKIHDDHGQKGLPSKGRHTTTSGYRQIVKLLDQLSCQQKLHPNDLLYLRPRDAGMPRFYGLTNQAFQLVLLLHCVTRLLLVHQNFSFWHRDLPRLWNQLLKFLEKSTSWKCR